MIPDTRAESLETELAEVDRQIDYSYLMRDKFPPTSKAWNTYDLAIDELLDLKDEIVKRYKEKNNAKDISE